MTEHDRKQCDCGAPLIRLMSLNKKVCPDCRAEYEWRLKDKQVPMIKHQR